MNDNIENINIWESNLAYKCSFIYSFEELTSFLDNNNIGSIIIHEQQLPDQKDKCHLDRYAINSIAITYTNKERPITIINNGPLGQEVLVNPFFFEQNKDKLIDYFTKKLVEQIKTKPFYLPIQDFLISDELIDLLITQQVFLEETGIVFSNITNQTLTENQIKKLQQNHLEVSIKGQQISSRFIISYYTIKNLKNDNSFTLKDDLSEEELNNFIHINENATIKITTNQNKQDELAFFNRLIRIFKILNKHQRTYNVLIEVNNRELLKQSELLNYTKNINLTINNDLYDYSTQEYLAEEAQLDKLIDHIKNSSLSPYEKYLAVYNIVKQFKPYQENKEDKEKARDIRYILNNEYIVCVGYSKLLKILLNKIGIPCQTVMSVGIDTSYDEGFTMEEKPTEIEKHARNIIKINDPKYGINGIFIADATWDNDMKKDLYANASMTFDRKKEAFRLEQLAPHDLLLDFHNQQEFIKKINFYLRRKINASNKQKYSEKLINAYIDTYQTIMEFLTNLDYEKYSELYDKYEDKINNANTKLQKLESICTDFLTEYAAYIIPLSNKKISEETLFTAATIARQTSPKYNQETKEALIQQIKATYQETIDKEFPYIYNPNDTREAYLTAVSENHKKR